MLTSRLMTELERVGAVMLDGHFVYTSGRHGTAYINKDAVYPHHRLVRTITELMASRSPWDVDVVAGPVVGGVILSTWVAQYLSHSGRVSRDVLSVYADKDESGGFVFKRGYDRLLIGRKTLIVEDVVNTGGSLKKTVRAARLCGADVIGAIALCNRGGITAEFLGVPVFSSLLDLPLVTFAEDDCHLCEHGVPINVSVGKGAEFLRRKVVQT